MIYQYNVPNNVPTYQCHAPTLEHLLRHIECCEKNYNIMIDRSKIQSPNLPAISEFTCESGIPHGKANKCPLHNKQCEITTQENNMKNQIKKEKIKMEKIENGYYYIKLPEQIENYPEDQPKQFESDLPPARCIWITDNKWHFSDDVYWLINPQMIEAKAFKVGQQVECKDLNSDNWENTGTFMGYVFESPFPYRILPNLPCSVNASQVYQQCRSIPEPNIEINIKINGKPAKLSDISEQSLKQLRDNN